MEGEPGAEPQCKWHVNEWYFMWSISLNMLEVNCYVKTNTTLWWNPLLCKSSAKWRPIPQASALKRGLSFINPIFFISSSHNYNCLQVGINEILMAWWGSFWIFGYDTLNQTDTANHNCTTPSETLHGYLDQTFWQATPELITFGRNTVFNCILGKYLDNPSRLNLSDNIGVMTSHGCPDILKNMIWAIRKWENLVYNLCVFTVLSWMDHLQVLVIESNCTALRNIE